MKLEEIDERIQKLEEELASLKKRRERTSLEAGVYICDYNDGFNGSILAEELLIVSYTDDGKPVMLNVSEMSTYVVDIEDESRNLSLRQFSNFRRVYCTDALKRINNQ